VIRVFALLPLLFLLACADTAYRFERIDGAEPVALPLKLERFSGQRDGASVKAQARLVDGDNVITMDIDLFLRPPAEFRAGAYHGTIDGKMVVGTVECPSLTFQGGQTALPNVGGVFVLNGTDNRPLFRVRIPATMLTAPPVR
jgi:hypothetical protein